jgi:type II restriction enzyme
MKLEFDEPQTAYISGAQNARVWTEHWVRDRLFCPNCGAEKIDPFESNRPVADFFCRACDEEYELKSQKNKFGAKVLDGAFGTMCHRLRASNNPNLLLLNYDLKRLAVSNLFVVPKHFLVKAIIEERKPLAATARRAGWVGCNILLRQIPESGKIFFVREGVAQPRESVLAQWQKTLFLREDGTEARGWPIEVMKCVEEIGKPEFTLDDVYAFEKALGLIYPDNNNVRPKIRQQLQVLRDRGYLEFVSRGYYRLRRQP